MVSTGDVDMDHAASSAPTLRGGLSAEASRLFRVYKTVSAMLHKRGYMVSREMRDITPASFAQKFGEHPSREALTILVVSKYGSFTVLIVVINGFTLTLVIRY